MIPEYSYTELLFKEVSLSYHNKESLVNKLLDDYGFSNIKFRKA